MSDTSYEAPRIYPALRYRDAKAMVGWLETAFGFARRVVYEAPDGGVAHAELAFGSAIIMMGSVRDDAYGDMVGEPGGRAGQSIYIAVDDADAHCARARAAGAEIVMDPYDTDHGSRDYICRDPEGYLWCFGTYWPKADETPSD